MVATQTPSYSDPKSKRAFVLALNGLRLEVSLGYRKEERLVPQWVRFSVRFKFAEPPPACESDELEHTICYGEISDRLREICAGGEYKTIESLASDAYDAIRSRVPGNVSIALQVLKEKPPVPGLEGGASVTLGDWQEGVDQWQG